METLKVSTTFPVLWHTAQDLTLQEFLPVERSRETVFSGSGSLKIRLSLLYKLLPSDQHNFLDPIFSRILAQFGPVSGIQISSGLNSYSNVAARTLDVEIEGNSLLGVGCLNGLFSGKESLFKDGFIVSVDKSSSFISRNLVKSGWIWVKRKSYPDTVGSKHELYRGSGNWSTSSNFFGESIETLLGIDSSIVYNLLC
jgi:hypothetical protein